MMEYAMNLKVKCGAPNPRHGAKSPHEPAIGGFGLGQRCKAEWLASDEGS